MTSPALPPASAGQRSRCERQSRAAEIFARVAASADFAMLDYFQTDDAGHARDFEAADRVLTDLDAFLRSLIEQLPLQRQSLLVVSDHGNLEDLSSRNHTLADVALLRFEAE